MRAQNASKSLDATSFAATFAMRFSPLASQYDSTASPAKRSSAVEEAAAVSALSGKMIRNRRILCERSK